MRKLNDPVYIAWRNAEACRLAEALEEMRDHMRAVEDASAERPLCARELFRRALQARECEL